MRCEMIVQISGYLSPLFDWNISEINIHHQKVIERDTYSITDNGD